MGFFSSIKSAIKRVTKSVAEHIRPKRKVEHRTAETLKTPQRKTEHVTAPKRKVEHATKPQRKANRYTVYAQLIQHNTEQNKYPHIDATFYSNIDKDKIIDYVHEAIDNAGYYIMYKAGTRIDRNKGANPMDYDITIGVEYDMNVPDNVDILDTDIEIIDYIKEHITEEHKYDLSVK